MTTTIETTTKTASFPIFKGAIYNTTVSNNTTFFGTDITPTNTPTTFRVQYVISSGSQTPHIQRTNGTNVVIETLATLNTGNTTTGDIFTVDFLVGQNDTINFIMPTGTGTFAIASFIVIEVQTAAGNNISHTY